MVHQHIRARPIDRVSVSLRHVRLLSRFSGSTGFPPFFSLVFAAVQAEIFGADRGFGAIYGLPASCKIYCNFAYSNHIQ